MEFTDEILDKKAAFMSKRERIGYSRAAFADAFGVAHRSIRRWESPTAPYLPNEDAIAKLDELNDLYDLQVGRAISTVIANTKALGEKPVVDLYYYPCQTVYEMIHPDEPGYFGLPNAVTRHVADTLSGMGYTVRLHYRNV